MVAPAFQAAGTALTSTGASVSPAWPTHQNGDIGILVVETSGNSATMSTPSGWTAMTGSPVNDVATTAGSKLHVFWKRATSSSEPAVATGALTDHVLARIYTFRAALGLGDPIDVATTGTKTTASSTATVPALTTTGADELIVMVVGRPDDSSSTTHFGVPSNANLTSLAEAGEAGTVSGNGGGFVVSYGTKATAGSTGTSTLSKGASTTDTYITFALKPLSKIETLTDNYDDNSLDATKWSSYANLSASIAETTNKIVLTPANSTVGSESGITSIGRFSLVSSSAVVQAVQVANTTNVFTNFQLMIDGSNYVGIGIGGGNLEFIQSVGGTFSTPYTTPYSSSVHKWWRVRESNGQVYGDYSADGITWVNFYHATNPITLSSLYVSMSVYEGTSTASPSAAQFDNFNIITAGDAIDTLVDDFNDNSISATLWNTYTAGGGTITETGSRLQYQLQATTNGSWAGLYSKVQYNLTGKRIQIESPAPTSGGNSWFDLTLALEQIPVVDNFFSIGIDFGLNQLQVVSEIGGTDTVLAFATYNSATHRYLSIRESGGTLYWEYSADAVTWTTLYSRATFPEIPITNLYVVIDDYEYNATSTPGTHYFDNLNVFPKMETIQDDFEFGGIDVTKWLKWGTPTINATTNLLLEMTSSAGNYGGLLSNVNYDLTGSYAFSQLVDAGNQALTSWEVYPVELVSGSNALSIMVNNNTVAARKKVAGAYTTVGTAITYNSTTMKWFRIRESGGQTYWEYATDPTSTWTEITTHIANPIAVTSLTAGITIGTWSGSDTASSVAKVDNFNVLPSSLQFSWKGYTWNKRVHQGDPTSWNKFSSSNLAVDGSGYLVVSLTNPTANAPLGAEVFTAQRGFGYGTYTAVIGTRLDNIPAAVGFGGLFTFDFTAFPDYKEIDSHETRHYNGNPNKRILHSHVYNNGGSRTFITDDMDIPADVVQTHVMKWEAGKITFDAYLGTGTSGTNYFHTEHTTNIPTPGLERVHFNIWVDTSISGYASVTPVDVVIRDFSFNNSITNTTNFFQFF